MHASYINVIYRIKYFTTKMTVKKLIYKIFFVVIKKPVIVLFAYRLGMAPVVDQ